MIRDDATKCEAVSMEGEIRFGTKPISPMAYSPAVQRQMVAIGECLKKGAPTTGGLKEKILKLLPVSQEKGMKIAELMQLLREPRAEVQRYLDNLIAAKQIASARLRLRGAPIVYWRAPQGVTHG
jgi:hypothetical protein